MADQSKLPEPTELVYAPQPTALPMLVATGLALIFFGLFDGWFYAVAGAAIVIATTIAWLRRANAEIAALPREQRPRSAALPLSAVQRPHSS